MAQTGEPPAEVVIRGVAVVDVEAGRLVPGRDIVVRGTRIERVRAGRRAAAARQDRDRRPRQGGDAGSHRRAGAAGGVLAGHAAGACSPPASRRCGDVGTDPAQPRRAGGRTSTTGRLYAPRLARADAGRRRWRLRSPRRVTSPAVARRHSRRPGAARAPSRPHARSGAARRHASSARGRCASTASATVAAGAPPTWSCSTANPLDDIRHTPRHRRRRLPRRGADAGPRLATAAWRPAGADAAALSELEGRPPRGGSRPARTGGAVGGCSTLPDVAKPPIRLTITWQGERRFAADCPTACR